MRYQIPQFIDVEDKIFGPLTLKQFIYIAGGAGLSFALWRTLPLSIAFVLIAPVAALSASLAFYKINNRPFLTTIEYAISYFFANKLYLWQVKKSQRAVSSRKTTQDQLISVPKLSGSRLKDLSWSLDIEENINPITRSK